MKTFCMVSCFEKSTFLIKNNKYDPGKREKIIIDGDISKTESPRNVLIKIKTM